MTQGLTETTLKEKRLFCLQIQSIRSEQGPHLPGSRNRDRNMPWAWLFPFFSIRCLCMWYVCLHVYTCACHTCVWGQSLALGAFLNHFLPCVLRQGFLELLIWFVRLTSLLGADITGRLPHPPTFMWMLRVWTRSMIKVTIKMNHHSCIFEILLLRNLVPALTVCQLSLLGFSMCHII